MNKILIIESPGKIKKIKSFLPNNFTVVASVGHIRDLDKCSLSIDDNYNPIYVLNTDKKDVVSNIRRQAKDKKILIATDLDYEGEAIADSIRCILKCKDNYDRVLFNEITQNAIVSAINNPKKINNNMVFAQQTRRILDRLVGYKISPILQNKFNMNKLAAGRVQSVIVKLLLEKENEINKFILNDTTYKIFGKFNNNIYCSLYKNDKIVQVNDKRILKYLLLKLGISSWSLDKIIKKKSIRKPTAPFITSTLQQVASNKLHMSIKTVMITAQKLYENGYITYMRTDCPIICADAHNDIKKFVISNFGNEYYNYKQYSSKNNAQEAHEAIRPTKISILEVTNLDSYANNLYKLIWKKTVSSQMSNAEFEITELYIKPKLIDISYMMIGKLNRLIFEGYLKVYNDNEDESQIINIAKDTKIIVNEIIGKEVIDHPATRYNEANLVRKLEHLGIGRPSTYAAMIAKIQDHKYAEIKDIDGVEKELTSLSIVNNKIYETKSKTFIGKESKKLVPTELGKLVTNYLNEKFPIIMDYEFTSLMEKDLDNIAQGKKNWCNTLKDFDKILNEYIGIEKVTGIEKPLFDPIGYHPYFQKPIYFLVGKYGPCIKVLIGKKDFFVSVKEKPDLDNAVKLITNKRTYMLMNKKK